MSYRLGHHSTSDDSTRYREAGEMARWTSQDPVARLRAWLEGQGAWSAAQEKSDRVELRRDAVLTLAAAGAVAKHPASDLFSDGAAPAWAHGT